MAYDWTQLGINEITNLYLYGTTTTPDDLANDSLIRPVGDPPPIGVDTTSYMLTGPGRFALGSKSWLVEEFFSGVIDLSWMEAGRNYTKAEFVAGLTAHGATIPEFYGIYVSQHQVDDASGDYLQRSYIWNSGKFALSDGALFCVDLDGNRVIKNYSIVPFGSENFDFVGGDSNITGIANDYLKPRIDPWNIGRTVNINFVGDVSVTRDYTRADYDQDVLQDALNNVAGALQMPGLFDMGVALVEQLWSSGVTQFVHQGKSIIYGSDGADTLAYAQLDWAAIGSKAGVTAMC